MAKNKKAKRIPKEIAGVKVPKEWRRKGERLIDAAVTQLESPQGKAMIAGGLSMAAAAVAAAAEKSRAKATAAAPEPERAAANDPARSARAGQPGIDPHAVGAAVDQFLSNIFARRA